MVVLGVISEPPQRQLASDRFGLGWYNCLDTPRLEPAKHLGVSIVGIRGHDFNGRTGNLCRRVEMSENLLAFIDLAGRNVHIDHYTANIVYYRMLFKAWLQVTIAARRRQSGIWVGG